MSQLFHHSTNLISRLTVYGGFVLVIVLGFVPWLVDRSPYVTYERMPIDHANELGIDCRYCHNSVEQSAFAGLPPTETCMTCHSQIWKNSPTLEPVRASFREDRSIEWVRVHKLPDFVYFDHSIHVAKGIGCTTCHGPIGEMPLTWSIATLKMGWCLNCHRNPEQYVRPREDVFSTSYQAPAHQMELGRKLVKEYGIYKLTDCYTCHR